MRSPHPECRGTGARWRRSGLGLENMRPDPGLALRRPRNRGELSHVFRAGTDCGDACRRRVVEGHSEGGTFRLMRLECSTHNRSAARWLEAVVEEADRPAGQTSVARLRPAALQQVPVNLYVPRCSPPSIGPWLQRAKRSSESGSPRPHLSRLLPVKESQLTSQRFRDNMARIEEQAIRKIERDLARKVTAARMERVGDTEHTFQPGHACCSTWPTLSPARLRFRLAAGLSPTFEPDHPPLEN